MTPSQPNSPLWFPGSRFTVCLTGRTRRTSPRSLVFGLMLAVATAAHAQPFAFTTLAGRAGVYGSGDGTNGSAQFTSPQAVAVDAVGVLYVADNVDNTIRRIVPQGANWVVSTIAGFPGLVGSSDGTNSVALFNQPGGITVDAAGAIYVADTGNNTIRKLVRGHPNTNWVVTTLAGLAGFPGAFDGMNSNARFNAPSGLAVDTSGNLYVADSSNNTIRAVMPSGTNWVVSTIAGLAGANNSGSADGTNSQARFSGPAGVGIDGAGKLYITDGLNHTIRRAVPMGANWVVTTLAGQAGAPGTADGANTSARFNRPAGIALDSNTNFYVADSANNAIRKGAPSGSNWLVSTVGGVAGPSNFGSSDGIGGTARFWFPQSVAADKSGNLYVADTWNATIRGGTVAIAVQIARSAGQVVLSWPFQATNYVLITSTSLARGATWLPLTNGVVTTATGYSLTQSISGTAAYYRLRK